MVNCKYNYDINLEYTYNAGDPGLIPGSERSPGEAGRLPASVFLSFPGGSDGRESACNVGDLHLIPELGRSPGGGHGSPLQYSCLENPHGPRSLEGYSPWGLKESDITERLSPAHSTTTYQRRQKYNLKTEKIWNTICQNVVN